MAELVLLWLLLLGFCIALVSRREGSGALLLAYFLGLSLIHVPGVIGYLGNAPDLLARSETQTGFEVTLVGMAALLIGAVVARRTEAGGAVPFATGSQVTWHNTGPTLLTFGLVTYFIVMPVTGFIPSAASMLGAVATLLIIGMCVMLFDATARRDRRRILALIAALPLLPLSTLATGGFLGYGVYWLIAILAFLFAISRIRWPFYLAAPFVAWLGLSLAVSYFANRGAIRDSVWYERASYADRFDRILQMANDFQPFDVDDPSQLVGIEARLNQNYFVGLAKERIDSGERDFQWGATVPWWALVPRAFWLGKPSVGGGRSVVADATGLVLAEGVSFGAGQPLEFYINFGWPGVVLGFFVLGYLFTRLDRRLAAAFRKGDLRGVIIVGMPGLSLLQPGGNLLEIIVGFFGAMITARIFLAAISAFERHQSGIRRARRVAVIS